MYGVQESSQLEILPGMGSAGGRSPGYAGADVQALPAYSEYFDEGRWFDCIEGWGFFPKKRKGWLNFPIFNQLELSL